MRNQIFRIMSVIFLVALAFGVTRSLTTPSPAQACSYSAQVSHIDCTEVLDVWDDAPTNLAGSTATATIQRPDGSKVTIVSNGGFYPGGSHTLKHSWPASLWYIGPGTYVVKSISLPGGGTVHNLPFSANVSGCGNPPTLTPTLTLTPTKTFTPTATSTTIPPTATFTPSSTSVPPTSTFTATSVPPTVTEVPPSPTPVPPSETPIPPSSTPIPPTSTKVNTDVPTATAVNTNVPTETSVPPTATSMAPSATVQVSQTPGTTTTSAAQTATQRSNPPSPAVTVCEIRSPDYKKYAGQLVTFWNERGEQLGKQYVYTVYDDGAGNGVIAYTKGDQYAAGFIDVRVYTQVGNSMVWKHLLYWQDCQWSEGPEVKSTAAYVPPTGGDELPPSDTTTDVETVDDGSVWMLLVTLFSSTMLLIHLKLNR